MGWVPIVLGVLQLTGGFSLFRRQHIRPGHPGSLAAASVQIGALLSIGAAYPWWSLAIFALCVYIVHGFLILGEDERAPAR